MDADKHTPLSLYNRMGLLHQLYDPIEFQLCNCNKTSLFDIQFAYNFTRL